MIPATYCIPIVPRWIARFMLRMSSAGWSGSTSIRARRTAGPSASGSPAGAQRERQARPRFLAHGHVHRRVVAPRHPLVDHVAADADHRQPGLVAFAGHGAEALAERVLPGPEPLGEGAADDGHARRVGVVALLDRSPLEQGQAHHGEVARLDPAGVHVRRLRVLRQWLALDLDAPPVVAIARGQDVRGGHARDAGQRREPGGERRARKSRRCAAPGRCARRG